MANRLGDSILPCLTPFKMPKKTVVAMTMTMTMKIFYLAKDT